MLTRQKEILDTILSVIREQYKDDIALMIVYGSAVNGTADERSDLDIFYIPKTEKGHGLAKTFILDGIGYDIWCGSWDRLHALMAWEDMRVSILADSELVYAASAEDREKYETMRDNARRRAELPDTAHDYLPALEFLNRAKTCYGEFCLGNRAALSGVLMELVDAVCYVNRKYLKYGAKKILEEISQYPALPDHFTAYYTRVIREPENAAELCKDMILSTETFVASHYSRFTGKDGLAAHCTGLYEEISSHWNKIRRSCESGDPEGAFMAAGSLQYNLDYAGAVLGQSFDLMSGWNPKDLNGFRAHCDSVEKEFVRALGENNIPVRYTESLSGLKQMLLDAYDEDQ